MANNDKVKVKKAQNGTVCLSNNFPAGLQLAHLGEIFQTILKS